MAEAEVFPQSPYQMPSPGQQEPSFISNFLFDRLAPPNMVKLTILLVLFGLSTIIVFFLLPIKFQFKKSLVVFMKSQNIQKILKPTYWAFFFFLVILILDSVRQLYFHKASLATPQNPIEGSSPFTRHEIESKFYWSQCNLYLYSFTLFLLVCTRRMVTMELELAIMKAKLGETVSPTTTGNNLDGTTTGGSEVAELEKKKNR
eukprot:TRINITY_DN12683_c0_g1_i1.p1 TRINITY_DN12683_c0_g1~~TRINITY_DN12683_c0_g1_i1.p1  ORF type:complete len:203 (-),score=14.55 TRINITY_DN12683_c0_g1_i1:130-738(-)